MSTLFAPISLAVSWFSALATVGAIAALGVVLAFGYAITRDADARGSDLPWLWGIGSVLAWPAALFYLLVYARRRERDSPADRGERAAWTLVLAGTVAFVLGAVFSPPDPYTQLAWAGVVIPAVLVPGYFGLYRRGGFLTRGR